MDTMVQEFVAQLGRIHEAMKALLEDLPPDALDWEPTEGANSLTVLVTHVAGSEAYWVGELILGQPAQRDRNAEFRAKSVAAGKLTRGLDDSLELIQAGLVDLPAEDLNRLVRPPRGSNEVSVAWALMHVLQHSSLHLGHMELTRQLWKARTS